MKNRVLTSALVVSVFATSLLGSSLSIASAAIIGTGTVQWSGALTTTVNWNDTFPWTASGTVNGILVTARVLPVLNMTISGSGLLNLGNLSSTAYSTGTVNIEVGTNAINGASVSAKSANGGLQNINNSGTLINSLTTDGFADSYRFKSTLGTTDSTAIGFSQSGSVDQEVNTTTPVTIYSSNKPQPLTNVDDFTLAVSAQANAQTVAGDYKDTVVLTVTGNF
jgi:hypothetical protein